MLAEKTPTRVCSECHNEFPISEFQVGNENSKRGIQTRKTCRQCSKDYQKAYYQANRDRCLTRSKQWQSENYHSLRVPDIIQLIYNYEASKSRPASVESMVQGIMGILPEELDGIEAIVREAFTTMRQITVDNASKPAVS